MFFKLREVMRFLLTLIHRECGQSKRSDGGLMVAMTALPDLPVTLTVSAAGAWCKKVTKSALQDVMERLAVRVPPCECIHQEELQKFADSFGCLLFTYSFHGGIISETMEADQTKIQMFLHRLSVVHAQVRMTLEIRTDSKKDQLIFRRETGSKVSVMDHSISLDSAACGQSPFSVQCLLSCPKVHPVLGDIFNCVLTTDAIGEGLCGEMRMATMATLTPCMDQYPNWPTRLSCIQMLVYSPCGMPLMHQRQMTFLQDLATSLSWADLAISKVSCMEAQTIEGSLCSEIKFSVDFCNQNEESGCSGSVHQNSEPEWSHAVEQILTLFIFTQYTDAFHSQVSDFISTEEALERHLDSVLWYNGDQVRADLQTTLRSTLKGFQKRQNARQRLQSTLTTVLSSVSSIIASSSNAKFRKTCYDSMRVTNTCEFRVSLQQSLQTVTDGRFAPRRMCNNEKMAEAVSSEQSSIEEDFENPPDFSPKRNDGDLGSSCSIPKKRQCSQFPETSDTFMNVMNSDIFEASGIQRRPLSPIQLPQSQQAKMTQDMPSGPSLTKLTKRKNKQVEKQWLQELENFSEWD